MLQSSNKQTLDTILESGKRRAWFRDFFVGVSRTGFWLAFPLAFFIFRVSDKVSICMYLVAYGLSSFLGGLLGLLAGYSWRNQYTHHLDRSLHAEGRIVNAEEYIHRASDDPILLLAIQEAESLIVREDTPTVQRRWPLDSRLIPMGAGLVVVTLIWKLVLLQ